MRIRLLLTLAAIVLFQHPFARAANSTSTWNGNATPDTNWMTPGNWLAGTIPNANDLLIFDGANVTSTNNFPAGTKFNGLTFNATASGFTLSGNSVLFSSVLDNAGGNTVGGSFVSNSPNPQAIGFPYTFDIGKHTFTTTGGGALNFSGALTRNTGMTAVFTTTSGAINFTGSGLANDASGIIGAWATMGNDWVALDGSNNIVAYTGYIPIATGAIASNANSNIRYINDTGNITAANGTLVNTILATVTGASRTLTVTTLMKLGPHGGIYRTGASTGNDTFTVTGGTITASGGGELTFSDATTTAGNFLATNNNLTITSIVANDGANPVSVSIMGYVVHSSANTYSGGTLINQGRIQASNGAAFGTGTVTVFPGAEAFLNNAGPFTNNFIISGVGSTENNGGITGPGAMRLNSNCTVSGLITMTGNTRITTSSATPTITGRITGTGRLEIATFANANENLILSNTGTPNDWTGGLLVSSLATTRQVFLKLGANNQIPDGPGFGDVTINGVDVARFDLNGFSETINGLNAAASANNQVSNFGTAPSTLTFGNNNANGNYAGVISDTQTANNLSLVKIGSGTQILNLSVPTGNNPFTGSLTVNGGTLAVLSPIASTAATTVANGATLQISNGGSLGGAGTSGNLSATTAITDNGTLVFAHNDSITIGNAITGTGGVTQLGTGMLTLTGSNSYSGTTSINAGILSIAASNNIGDASATNTISIANATLQSTANTLDLGANRSVALGTGGATFDVATGNTLTISGPLTGSTNLSKINPGTLALAGASPSYSGTILVTAGTLAANASMPAAAVTLFSGTTLTGTGPTGPMTVNANATLAPGTTGAGTLSTAAFSITNGMLNFDLGDASVPASNDLIAVTGDLALNGGTVNVNGLSGFGGPTYTLFTYTGNLTSQNLSVGTMPIGYVGTLDFSTAHAVKLNVVLNVATRTWTAGGADTKWSTVANWDTGVPQAGDAVVIGNAGSAVNVDVPVDITILTINRPVDVTISGAGPLGIRGGGITVTGSNNHTISCPVVLEANQSWILATGTLTVSGLISTTNNSSLSKGGPGTLLLTNAANSFGGTGKTITVSGGTLSVDTDSELGNSANSVTLNGGGFQATASVNSARQFNLGQNNGSFDVTTNFTLTLSNGIGGTGALTKTNTGTLLVSGLNNYNGTTTVSAGFLQIGSGGTSGTLGAGNVTNNGILIFNRTDALSVPNVISGSGSLIQQGAGTTTLSGTNSYSGSTGIAGGILSINSNTCLGDASATNTISLLNGGVLQFTGASADLGGNRAVTLGTGGGGFDVAGASVLTVSGAISGNSTLTKSNTGTVILTNINTNSGPVAINGGILSISASSGLGDGSATNVLSLAGGTLQNTGASVDLTPARTVTLGTGGGGFDVTGANVLTVSGVISGSGTLTKTNTGTLILSATNTNSGPVAINGGIVSIASSSNLGDGSATNTIIMGGGTLMSTAATLDLTPARTIALNAGGGFIDVPGGNVLTISGVISGTGGLTKLDAGTLILSAANTYGGATIIDNGTLTYTVDNFGVKALVFGATQGSPNVGSLDLSTANLTATSLLAQNNAAGNNTITIGNSETLTVNGTLLIGGQAATATVLTVTTNLTISGSTPGAGTFVCAAATPTTFQVSNGTNGGNGSSATLDMTNLGTFSATVTNMQIGDQTVGAAGNRGTGTLTLAATNTINASGTLTLGMGNANAGAGTLNLGQTNTLNIDTVLLGDEKSVGTIRFRAGLTNPTVVLRGAGGGNNRVTTATIGSMREGGTPSGANLMDFTAGTGNGSVDARIATLNVGKSTSTNGATVGGTLSFSAGTIDATTVILGTTSSTGPATGTVNVSGTANLVMGTAAIATNTITGGTTTGATGTFNLSGTATVASGPITLATQVGTTPATGTLNINGGTMTLSGSITAGTGTSSLALNNGTLDMGGNTIGTAANPIGTLTFAAGTLKNVLDINGGAAIAKTTTGTLFLEGINSFGGAFTISAGAVQVGTGGTTGTLGTGNVTTNGALIFSRSNTLNVNNIIDGTGTVAQFGSGNVTLTGVNPYSGNTFVNAGTMTINGSASNSPLITVGAGATLAGSGTAGPVMVTGGTLSGTLTTGTVSLDSVSFATPGGTGTVGTLHTGSFSLFSGILNYDLSMPASSDLIAVTGDADLTGTLNITSSNFPSGTYTILTYTGNLLNQNLTVGTLPSGASATLDFTATGVVKLNVTAPQFRTWTALGANTLWSNPANWDGGVTIPAAGDSVKVVTAGTTITVDVATDISSLNITRDTDVSLTGSGPGTLGIRSSGVLITGLSNVTVSAPVVLNANQTWATGSGTLAVSGNISGNFALTTGGTATFTGTNTYGATTINSGTLQIGTGSATGTLGSGAVTDNGTLKFNLSANVTVANAIGGTGGVQQLGSGTLTLSGANSYAGATTVLSCVLQLGSATALGDISGATTVLDGAALDLNGQTVGAETLNVSGSGIAGGGVIFNSSATTASLSGAVNLNADSTISTGTVGVTLGGAISGNSALTKIGAGTLTLSGNNQYAGATTVGAGILRAGNANALGTTAGITTISAGAALDLNGQALGAETLNISGTGVANSGAIFNSSANPASAAGNISFVADSTVIASSGSIALNGVISGTTANLTKDGAGMLILTGTNTYAGNTTIVAGTIRIGTATGNSPLGAIPGGSVTIVSGATLDVGGYTAANVATPFGAKQFFVAGTGVGGLGAIVNNSANNQQNLFQQVRLTADTAFGGTGRWDLRGGAPQLDLAGFTLTKVGNAQLSLVGTTVTDGNIVTNQGTTSIEAGSVVTGNGTLTWNDGTIFQLYQAITMTRPIVFNGNVTWNNDNTAAVTVGSPITLQGELTFGEANANGVDSLTLTGNLTEAGGTHSITVNRNGTGANTITLAGTNVYSGVTTINAGTTLQIGNAGTSGTLGSGSVNDAGSLVFNRTDAIVVANVISGAGVVTMQGTGTVTLTGTSTYTGATTISAGALRLGNNGTTGSLSAATTIADNASLIFSRTDALTFSNTISGSGSVQQTGTGTTTLSGNVSHTGGTFVTAGALTIPLGTSLPSIANVNNGAVLNLLGSSGAVSVNGSLASSPATSGSRVRGKGTAGALAASDASNGNAVVWPGTAQVTSALIANETLACSSCTLSNGGKLVTILKHNGGNPLGQKLITTGTTAPTLSLDSTSTLSIATDGAFGDSFIVVDTGITTAGITFSFANINAGPNLVQGVDYDLIYRDTVNSVDIVNPPAGSVLVDALSNPHAVNQLVVKFKSTGVTPVRISSFNAIADGTGVLLEWKAASEFQNLGFNLYRRPAEPRTSVSGQPEPRPQGSGWTRINPALIPGRITQAEPKTYRLYDWPDPGIYEYKLDSVSLNGNIETFPQFAGPLSVEPHAQTIVSAFGINAALSSLSDLASMERAKSFMPEPRTSASGQPEPRTSASASHSLNSFAQRSAAVLPSPLGGEGPGVTGAAVRAIPPANSIDLATSRDRITSRDRKGAGTSATTEPTAGIRWFTATRPSSGAFTAAKIVYDTPDVLAIPRASLPAGFDAAHVAIQREGRNLTALALTPTALIVYGQGYQDDYTSKDALFLRATTSPTQSGSIANATGLFASAQAASNITPAFVTTSYHDIYFDYNYRPYTFPPWFSSQYLTDGTDQIFSINTLNAIDSTASLTVNLWSLSQSESGVSPDHALIAVLNGQSLGQAQWTGGGKMISLTFSIPSGALAGGTNQIELITPALHGIDSQISFLHSMNVSYTRALDASAPLTVMNVTITSQLFEAANLPSADVWVVDARFPDRAALVPYETQAQADGTFRIRFVAASGGTGNFLVVPVGQENAPLSITKSQVKPAAAFKYLAVGPDQFSAGVQPLLLHHSKEGLRAAFVSQEQLFDYYNYGRYGPTGIQNAVRAARPKYVLLVGRTHTDYLDYSGAHVDPLCPAFLVSTTFFAQTTSDSLYGDLGRGYPEVSVGRLPVNGPTDLANAVHNVLSNAGLPISNARVHTVADLADPAVGDFAALSDAVAAQNPDLSWQRNYLGITNATPPESTLAFTAAANGGADLLMFTGHGSSVHLGNTTPPILDQTSVQSWTGHSVLIQVTCNGNWMAQDVAGFRSIAIQALTQPQGGIAASIGTSTYMNPQIGAQFAAQFISTVNSGGSHFRWGDALMRAQQWALQQTGNPYFADLGRTEQIFGDPAMPVYAAQK
ncbi:MAG TPA: autotransporter-associated beta strand repeat-containing protein [Planctomycetota bacterium]|nr:autotransporter-associated beta strand repeat-containing protein [Planctomycetota bacterium]